MALPFPSGCHISCENGVLGSVLTAWWITGLYLFFLIKPAQPTSPSTPRVSLIYSFTKYINIRHAIRLINSIGNILTITWCSYPNLYKKNWLMPNIFRTVWTYLFSEDGNHIDDIRWKQYMVTCLILSSRYSMVFSFQWWVSSGFTFLESQSK